MKRVLFTLAITVFLCFTISCQQSEEIASKPKAEVQADIEAIKDIITGLEAAVNAGDVDKIMSSYAKDAIRIPPNEPAAIGKEAIQSRNRQELDEITAQDVYTIKDIKVSGDLAIAHYKWSSTITFKGSNKKVYPHGNYIVGLERQSDGLWKRIYNIWSDELLLLPKPPE